jgi:antitoxin HicB
MFAYPARIEKDTNGSYLLTFRDLPEVSTVGDSAEEALANAVEAIELAIELYFDEKRVLPSPSKAKRGEAMVYLPAMVSAKALLVNEMIQQKIRKADLARKLHWHKPQVDRLLDPRHSSKIEMVEQALAVVGKRLELQVV